MNFERKILEILRANDCLDGESYMGFFTIIRDTGLTRKEIAIIMKGLRKRGLVDFQNGLSSDEGGVGGSGYAITSAGLKFLDAPHETPL